MIWKPRFSNTSHCFSNMTNVSKWMFESRKEGRFFSTSNIRFDSVSREGYCSHRYSSRSPQNINLANQFTNFNWMSRSVVKFSMKNTKIRNIPSIFAIYGRCHLGCYCLIFLHAEDYPAHKKVSSADGRRRPGKVAFRPKRYLNFLDGSTFFDDFIGFQRLIFREYSSNCIPITLILLLKIFLRQNPVYCVGKWHETLQCFGFGRWIQLATSRCTKNIGIASLFGFRYFFWRPHWSVALLFGPV